MFKMSQDSCIGVLYMLSNAFMISLSGLSFRYSQFPDNEITSWTGYLGSVFGVMLLITEIKDHRALRFFPKSFTWLVAFCGSVFGGSSIFFFCLSLRYVIPSDTLVVKFFTSITCSIVLEIFKQRKRPSLLAVASICFGLGGTIAICKPETLFQATLDCSALIGVAFASLSGLCASLFYFVLWSRNPGSVPDSWPYIWFMVGAAILGSLTYRPHGASIGSCTILLRVCAITSSLCQVGCGITAIKAIKSIAPSAAFVFQLFSSAITFILQAVIFPGIVTWSSSIGTVLVTLAIILNTLSVRRASNSKNSPKT